jgi:hypothetical protein
MRRVPAAAAAVLAFLLLAAPAAHASGRDVVRDCTDNGRIDSYHSAKDYKAALGSLPSDVAEYTDCRQIIEAAQRRDAHRSPPGSGGGGGGSFPGGTGVPSTGAPAPASPAESNALKQAAAGGGAPVPVAGEPITPGGSGVVNAAVRHALPTSVIVLLVLLGLGALAWATTVARARGLQPPLPVLRALDRVFPRRA